MSDSVTPHLDQSAKKSSLHSLPVIWGLLGMFLYFLGYAAHETQWQSWGGVSKEMFPRSPDQLILLGVLVVVQVFFDLFGWVVEHWAIWLLVFGFVFLVKVSSKKLDETITAGAKNFKQRLNDSFLPWQKHGLLKLAESYLLVALPVLAPLAICVVIFILLAPMGQWGGTKFYRYAYDEAVQACQPEVKGSKPCVLLRKNDQRLACGYLIESNPQQAFLYVKPAGKAVSFELSDVEIEYGLSSCDFSISSALKTLKPSSKNR